MVWEKGKEKKAMYVEIGLCFEVVWEVGKIEEVGERCLGGRGGGGVIFVSSNLKFEMVP